MIERGRIRGRDKNIKERDRNRIGIERDEGTLVLV